MVCIGLLALALLVPASAGAAEPKPVSAPAQVWSIGYCDSADGFYDVKTIGGFRWSAVKGVTSYTLVFNDGAYGGAEQRVPVSADAEGNWADDNPPEGEKHPDWNAPKGIHQMLWTGGVGFGPGGCEGFEQPDYSGRLTNARVEYLLDGEYVMGTVKGPCQNKVCPPLAGVRVTAKGPGGGSATTDPTGAYSIKVKKGTYEVTAKKGGLDFSPGSHTVKVGTDRVKTVNFTAKHRDPKPKLVGAIARLVVTGGKGTPHAQIFRDGKWRPLKVGDDVGENARVRTNGDTEMAIELDLGGRVVVRPSSEVRVGERSVSGSESAGEPWQVTKGSVWAQCGQMKESLEIQTTGGIMGITDTRGGKQPRLPMAGEQVGTITSLAAPETLQVTPKGGIAAPAQQGQTLGLGDLLSPSPGVAATLQLARPASVGKNARLVMIEPQGGAEPIVSIDRPDDALSVEIKG